MHFALSDALSTKSAYADHQRQLDKPDSDRQKQSSSTCGDCPAHICLKLSPCIRMATHQNVNVLNALNVCEDISADCWCVCTLGANVFDHDNLTMTI